MLAIIGGSGLAKLSDFKMTRRQVVQTPYGEPSSPLAFGTLGGGEIVFLARHGYGHTIPPHEINYRANIWALHAQGVKRVLAVASVGGIRADLGPGVLAVPDQIVDYTHGRAATFVAGNGDVSHADFTYPYCAQLRAECLAAARRAGENIVDGGVYGATQGPRLETAAEINRFERDGVDMVGMTGMPEAVLAREIGLCYAALAVVANHAAGRGSSSDGIAMSGITTVLEPAMKRVRVILEQLTQADGG
ncbi:MAG TPA: S-methyl-5'-thioinosine phosphorylase [Burkholderiales bacterium]|nr:S-methyl-5'-thioinosine phosphorylase [Burkholderiales bacterium]